MANKTKTPVWMIVVSVLLALVFFASGLTKLIPSGGQQQGLQDFATYGYPTWFFFLIGIAEVFVGIGFLSKRTRFYSAVTAIVLMIGAIFSLVRADMVGQLPIPTVALVLSALVARNSR